MSFGYSVADAFLLVQLAWKTVQNSRKACGEHDELTREVLSLHLVIRRLEKEVSRSESPINRPDDTCKEELRAIVGGSEKVLQVLNKKLEKYNTLSEKERSAKKLWQRVRFGNGELADMRDLREKLTYYTSALSLFVNMISMDFIGRVEEQMENAGGDIKEIRIAINGITAHLMSGSNREGSVLTTYADDDKAVWKEFRKELIEEGFSSSIITKHKRLIKAYIKELGDRGLLDDEDPHDIKNLSEEDGANTDNHATLSTNAEGPPKAASKVPSKTESDMSEDDLLWATRNGVETTPRVISDTGSFSDPIRTWKSSGSERMEEERKEPQAYKDEGVDCRRVSRREREAEQAAEEIKRDRRINSRDKDRRRDVDLKLRDKFGHFMEDNAVGDEVIVVDDTEVLEASAGSGGGQKKGHVLYDFMAQGEDEVTVAVGDEVIVVDDTKSDEWWTVRRLKNEKEGVIPSTYVKVTGIVAPPRTSSDVNVDKSVVKQNRLNKERMMKETVKASKIEVKAAKRSKKESKHGRSFSASKSKLDMAKTRTWTDRSGTFKTKAQFIGLKDGKIHLHKLNEVKIAVPVVKMAIEDLEYVEEVTGVFLDDDIPLSDINDSDSEIDIPSPALRNPSRGPRPDPSSAPPQPTQPPKKPSL